SARIALSAPAMSLLALAPRSVGVRRRGVPLRPAMVLWVLMAILSVGVGKGQRGRREKSSSSGGAALGGLRVELGGLGKARLRLSGAAERLEQARARPICASGMRGASASTCS